MTSRPPSPAMLILLEHGIGLGPIADRLDITRQAVSYHLNGHTTDASDVIAAIRELAGPDIAAQVAVRIDNARIANQTEEARP